MSKYAFAMMTSLAVLMLSVEQAKAIVQPPKNPVHVGKAGNNQKAAKKVKGTTSPTGKITYDMKNTSGRAATDVHIEITSMTRGETPLPWPSSYKIGSIRTAEIDDDTSHMTGEPSDDGSSAEAECKEGESLENGKQLKVSITIVDDDGNPQKDIDVEYKVWWTEFGDAICATHTKEIGEGRPRTRLEDVVPGYNPEPAVIVAGAGGARCNDICLAETDGYRFQDGDIVLEPTNSASFAITLNTEVVAFTEEGERASPKLFQSRNLRIDDRGNFVFSIDRSQQDELHVVLVIRGLAVVDLERHDVGQEIQAGASGSAISGYCLEELYTLVRVVE